MTVTLRAFVVQVTPQIQRDLRLATREAVNKSALAVTQDARARVSLMLGDNRLSGYLYNPSGSRVGTAGGRLIYPKYKPAINEQRPTALVGAIGPAHLIEHNRRGGYDIEPHGRRGRPGGTRRSSANAFIESMLGRPVADSGSTKAHAAAVGRRGSDMFRAKVKGGFILRPGGGPITTAFERAPQTVARLAEYTIEDRVNRMRY